MELVLIYLILGVLYVMLSNKFNKKHHEAIEEGLKDLKEKDSELDDQGIAWIRKFATIAGYVIYVLIWPIVVIDLLIHR